MMLVALGDLIPEGQPRFATIGGSTRHKVRTTSSDASY